MHHPAEHKAVDEAIEKFKGESRFSIIHPPPQKKTFGIESYTFYNRSGYTYIMSVYFVNERILASMEATPTHGTVLELFQKA
jgi:hypothetical protein